MNNQLEIGFAPLRNWGGKRRGAGRKRRRARPAVPHRKRPEHRAYQPVHVTQRISDRILRDAGLRTLRRRDVYRIIERAFAYACNKDTAGGKFRICQYSVQRDHMHLLVEADSRAALSRGMQGFSIRVAKGINRFLGHKGRVFDDRYHQQIVTNPRQARNVLSYVILNGRKHGEHRRERVCWSASWFDGFVRAIGPPQSCSSNSADTREPSVAGPKTWLLRVGWRLHGLIDPSETPGCR